MSIMVNGRPCYALVDTGCEETVIYEGCAPEWERRETNMTAVNGSVVRCCGMADVRLEVQGRRAAVRAVVVDERLMGVDVLLGMTGVEALGGVFVRSGDVRFGGGDGVGRDVSCSRAAAAQVCYAEGRRIESADFLAEFGDGKWVVRWKWADGQGPQCLTNTVPQYRVPEKARQQFDAEIKLWMEEGWLQPYDEREMGPPRGLIPLMAVTQEAKGKVRPVLDFRELNEYLAPHTADSDVCVEQLRKWRRHGDDVAVIDLKKAFLQLHVAPELWPFQTVIVGGQRLALTRLGFGISVAPEIMRSVVREVLDQNPVMANAVLPYADDLLVNESQVSAGEVVQHFARYGLTCKVPERVAEGARMLGLRVKKGTDSVLRWTRDDATPARPPDVLTRRSVFSWAGQLISHVPVAGWLRPAAAWLKRSANKASNDWDTPISDGLLCDQVKEVSRRVEEADPARGQWTVKGDAVVVWTDASSIARGVVLADPVTDEVIEDAAWLRTDTDSDMHINLSELDAALNGVNMALAWEFRRIDLRTDSVTVHRWLTDALSGRARLRTKAQSEMLIRRRVAVFRQLVTEYDLTVSVQLVPSAANRADALTRVPSDWLKVGPDSTAGAVAAVRSTPRTARAGDILAVHENIGHQGVRRTLWYARRELGSAAVTKSAVRAVVRSCQVCASVDPAPTRWKHGTLEVERTWERLAMDVTHFRGRLYLTLVDCGPSRYAIWRELRHSDAGEIVRHLETIFLERGAPAEILTDNATEFRGRVMMAFAARWDVRMRYRAVHEPGGNSIVERHHRTVKVMATRQDCSVPEAVHRYNATPKDGRDASTAPMHGVLRQAGSDLRVQSHESRPAGPPIATARPPGVFRVGDPVWARKRGERCTAVSREGVVTNVLSPQTVEVDGVPWHVRNIRHRLTCHGGAEIAPNDGDPPSTGETDFALPVPPSRVPERLAIEGHALAPAPTRLVVEADTERDLSTAEPQLEMDGGDDLTEGCDGENGGSEASAEGPRRGTRCRRATQLYGEPIPSDVT